MAQTPQFAHPQTPSWPSTTTPNNQVQGLIFGGFGTADQIDYFVLQGANPGYHHRAVGDIA
jgi:hypothetical protein